MIGIQATKEGLTNAFFDYKGTVAKRTGSLRDEFQTAVISQNVVWSGNKIHVKWKNIEAQMLDHPYAKYHIDGRPYHPGDLQYSKTPDRRGTLGTKPISSYTFMEKGRREIRAELKTRLKAKGFEF